MALGSLFRTFSEQRKINVSKITLHVTKNEPFHLLKQKKIFTLVHFRTCIFLVQVLSKGVESVLLPEYIFYTSVHTSTSVQRLNTCATSGEEAEEHEGELNADTVRTCKLRTELSHRECCEVTVLNQATTVSAFFVCVMQLARCRK